MKNREQDFLRFGNATRGLATPQQCRRRCCGAAVGFTGLVCWRCRRMAKCSGRVVQLWIGNACCTGGQSRRRLNNCCVRVWDSSIAIFGQLPPFAIVHGGSGALIIVVVVWFSAVGIVRIAGWLDVAMLEKQVNVYRFA